MAVDNRDLNLILAGLFDLRITCVKNEQTCNAIDDLAEKLGGDRAAMYFGAPLRTALVLSHPSRSRARSEVGICGQRLEAATTGD
jgi:hypothetical protein